MKTRFLLVLFGFVLGSLAQAAVPVTDRGPGLTSETGSGSSAAPILSRDGRYITFLSDAADLTGDTLTTGGLNIFRYDRLSSNIVLVTAATNGASAAPGAYRWITTSSNGAFVAFVSDVPNLVSGDTNRSADVFVRDVVSGTTLLVSADTNGLPARRPSGYDAVSKPFEPWLLNGNTQISADGRFVAFESTARALVADLSEDWNNAVYLRDLHSNTTRLISRTGNSAKTDSKLMSMTPDAANVVLSEAQASDPFSAVLFVRSTTNGHLRQLTWLTNETPVSAVISENGGVVAISALLGNRRRILTWDLTSDTIQVVRTNLSALARTPIFISGNGQYLTYDDGSNVYRWNGAAQTNEVVSVTYDAGSPAGGITQLRSVNPSGNKILFASDATNLVAGVPGGTLRLYWRDMLNSMTHLVADDAGSADVSTFANVIAFDTRADNLVPNDRNAADDVFLRDLGNGEVTLVSRRAPDALHPTTASGHARIYRGSISSNGQYLAFTSYDSNLVPDDTNHIADAFIADLVSGQVDRAGTNVGTVRAVNLTPDGRYLVKVTTVPEHRDDWIYRYDRTLNTEQFVVRRARGTGPTAPAISADSSEVAYLAGGRLTVTNFATGESWIHPSSGLIPVSEYDALFGPGQKVVYRTSGSLGVWDRATGSSVLVANSAVYSAALGGNNLYFGQYAETYIRSISRFDFASNSAEPIHEMAGSLLDGLSVSGDGGRVVGEIADFSHQAFVYDLPTRDYKILSTTANGVRGNGASKDPQISLDGRYVVYVTKADNLVPNRSAPYTSALVVRDLLLGTTTLLVANAEGKSPNSHVSKPIISGDGRTVAFQSVASDIVPGDYNDRSDIFVLKLGSADSDADGMDDDWEVAHFGNLTRNGSGDADEDGTSDYQEFLAGTNPTTSTSVFRVMTLSTVGSSGKQVVWTGNPDRSYRVEYKDNLNAAAWTALSGTPVWTGTTATVLDPASTASRFYRVVRLP